MIAPGMQPLGTHDRQNDSDDTQAKGLEDTDLENETHTLDHEDTQAKGLENSDLENETHTLVNDDTLADTELEDKENETPILDDDDDDTQAKGSATTSANAMPSSVEIPALK
jgi:hypothetical protein